MLTISGSMDKGFVQPSFSRRLDSDSFNRYNFLLEFVLDLIVSYNLVDFSDRIDEVLDLGRSWSSRGDDFLDISL